MVARDLKGSWAQDAIEAKLRKINRKQVQRNIGPLKMATFRPYQSMFKKLMERTDKESAELRRFVSDRRKKYDGDFLFFHKNNNEKKWKKVLIRSMGVPGKQFASLLDQLTKNGRVRRNDGGKGNTIIDLAITRILRNRTKFHELLWRGAFCYVFLRCMYGIDEYGEVYPSNLAPKWSELLLNAIRSQKTNALVSMGRYVSLIKRSAISPPWKSKTKQLKKTDRIVLANIRFYVFYNLYIRPSPRGGVE